jgi:uncharacterized protein (DUF305 family)
MKLVALLFTAAAMYLLAACNNGTETSSANADTSNTTTNGSGTQAPAQDTTHGGVDLAKPMNDMMARAGSMPMSGDFDVDFANMMIEHHQSAIDMAQVELSHGKDATMKAKAQEIIAKQKQEQQQLRDFMGSYKPSGMKHGKGELQSSMSGMGTKMKSMPMSGDVDKDFAMMMTSHHQDGVSMAKMELKNGMSDKLKAMAQKIITDQQKDIKEFQAWASYSNKQ